MNPVLARQLRRLGLDVDAPPASPEVWRLMLERVGRFYDDADRSRYLLERSLRISSQEMIEANRRMREIGEARLHRTESHYRTLFEVAPIGLWEEDYSAVGRWLEGVRDAGVRDLQGHFDAFPDALVHGISLIEVIGYNPAVAQLTLAADPDELLGRVDPSVYTQDSLDSYRLQFQAIWDDTSRISYEFTGQRLDGTTLEGILHWSAPVVGGKLDLTRVVVAIVDITARRESERRMEELVRSKDEFLAAVSHELRTPLTAVFGSAEALLDQWSDLGEDVRLELVHFIARESGELADMVEDLLVAARADIGRVNVTEQCTDLRTLVDRVVETATGASGTIDTSEVDGAAWADPLRLRQIVRNLITNAIRYGGPTVKVQSERIGDRVFLTVLDDGAGVPPDRREAIFELYQRAHPDHGLAGSVGVGLAVSRQLARLMGGDLTYDRGGDWSRFRLTLRASAASGPALRRVG